MKERLEQLPVKELINCLPLTRQNGFDEVQNSVIFASANHVDDG